MSARATVSFCIQKWKYCEFRMKDCVLPTQGFMIFIRYLESLYVYSRFHNIRLTTTPTDIPASYDVRSLFTEVPISHTLSVTQNIS